MMTDKELADSIVALGVGESTLGDKGELYRYDDRELWSYDDAAEIFVRDPRVAMALIELVLDKTKDRKAAWRSIDPQGGWISMTKPISVPRAISEACVKALEAYDRKEDVS